MTPGKRSSVEDRQDEILECALKMATGGLWMHITRREVAARLGISPGLINHYFHGIEDLRDQVIALGCSQKIPRIIAVGLAVGHPDAVVLPDAVKRRAAVEA